MHVSKPDNHALPYKVMYILNHHSYHEAGLHIQCSGHVYKAYVMVTYGTNYDVSMIILT